MNLYLLTPHWGAAFCAFASLLTQALVAILAADPFDSLNDLWLRCMDWLIGWEIPFVDDWVDSFAIALKHGGIETTVGVLIGLLIYYIYLRSGQRPAGCSRLVWRCNWVLMRILIPVGIGLLLWQYGNAAVLDQLLSLGQLAVNLVSWPFEQIFGRSFAVDLRQELRALPELAGLSAICILVGVNTIFTILRWQGRRRAKRQAKAAAA